MIPTHVFDALAPALWVHLAAAILAVGLGPLAIYRRRRDIWHRTVGYLWVTSMLVLAVGSFWIEAQILPLVSGYGPIHLLSIYAVWILWQGVGAARAGRIARHRGMMRGLYWNGLLIAGVFTLLPHRTLNRALFPGQPELGYVAVAGLAAVLIGLAVRDRRKQSRRVGGDSPA